MNVMTRKRYVAKKYDGDYESWQVWEKGMAFFVAEFYGKGARAYARAHANRLNALPKEDQP